MGDVVVSYELCMTMRTRAAASERSTFEFSITFSLCIHAGVSANDVISKNVFLSLRFQSTLSRAHGVVMPQSTLSKERPLFMIKGKSLQNPI